MNTFLHSTVLLPCFSLRVTSSTPPSNPLPNPPVEFNSISDVRQTVNERGPCRSAGYGQMTLDPYRVDSIIASKCHTVVRLNIFTLEEEVILGNANQSGYRNGIGKGEKFDTENRLLLNYHTGIFL